MQLPFTLYGWVLVGTSQRLHLHLSLLPFQLRAGTSLHLGDFICTPTFSSHPKCSFHLRFSVFHPSSSALFSGSSPRIFIFIPNFIRLGDICLTQLHLCHLSGSSSRIFIFSPKLIRLGDICLIRLQLCHLPSSSASSHPFSLVLTVSSHLPQHLYLYSTDQGPEHKQAFIEDLYRYLKVNCKLASLQASAHEMVVGND